MTQSQRDQLVEEYARSRDPTVRHRIMDAAPSRDLVKKVIRGYQAPEPYSDHDLFQEGFIGFAKGLETFSSKRHVRFSTYCYNNVQWEISKAIRERYPRIRLTRYAYDAVSALNKAERELCSIHNCDPAQLTDYHLAQYLGCSLERLNEARMWRDLNKMVSLNELDSEEEG